MSEPEITEPIDISEGIQEYGRTLRGENKTTKDDILLTSPVHARAMVRFWRKFADRADVRADPNRR